MTTSWSTDLGPEEGPFSVRIDKGEWIDFGRGERIVRYKIYRPEVLDNGPYPVVVWSHGLGGTRDGAGFIGRHLASHGYIQVNVDHEGTNDSLWRGLPGHPWDNIKKAHIPWEDVRNRYLDIPFALSNLDALYPILLDWNRFGMSGHSFGALTTQVMAGQMAGKNDVEDLRQTTFKAGILYSPVPDMRLQQGGASVYAPIDMPLLHITGTNDSSPVEGFGYERRLEVFEGAGHEDQHLLILNGADHMVFNGSRGQLPPYDGMDAHQDIMKVLSLAWWEAHLNKDIDAAAWLNGQGVIDYIHNSGVYRRR